jgi:hypothetical protein
LRGDPGLPRSQAAHRLHSCFPANRGALLPTELGNVLRSFETHPRKRYCLDGITIWPRIQLLLSEEERMELEDASADMMFFVNGIAVGVITGVVLAVSAAAVAPSMSAAILRAASVVAATALVTWLAWRASIGAARRWGAPVRAAFDLHRLELFDRLGVKLPLTTEEDEHIGRAVSRMLLYAEPLPDACRKEPVHLEPQEAGKRV